MNYPYPNNMLVERVRESKDGRWQPIGVLVGVNDNGYIRVGWSKCMVPPPPIPKYLLEKMTIEARKKYHERITHSDRFNLNQGISQAFEKIIFPSNPPCGRKFAKKVAKFRNRCIRYFKEAQWVQIGDINVLREDLEKEIEKERQNRVS
jgi:hypothetical protein